MSVPLYQSGGGSTLSSSTVLPNGVTATTQAALSNDTKVATDAYVDSAVAAVVQAANATLGCFFGGLGNPWVVLQNSAAVSTAGPSLAGNNVHVIMFVLEHEITINKITYSVTTPSASDRWGFGIYSTAGNKLVDSGVLSPSLNATAVPITLGTPVTLPAGVYFFAQASSGTTAQTNFYITNTTFGIPMMNTSRARCGLAANAFSSSTGLPPTLGAISTATTRSPMLVLFEN